MDIEEKSSKGRMVRNIYFYIASAITLGITVGALIFLISLGLKFSLLKNAEPPLYELGSPAHLYLESQREIGVIDISEEQTVLECEEECELTATQIKAIENWENNYSDYREAIKDPNSIKMISLVSALSFLIIALPFFIIHFRVTQKDYKNGERTIMRPIYFYFVSLASLLMIVIAGGTLINLGLKSLLITETRTENTYPYVKSIEPGNWDETASIQSLIDCQEECGINEETVALANEWIEDYEEWEVVYEKGYNSNQRQAASSIPYLLLGIPLFWYHFRRVKKESKKHIN